MYARAAPPGRAGIALVALNGGQNVENANGLTVARLPDAESTALRFNFAVGQAPFLVIPQSGRTITLRQGGAVAVNWSSNRRQKNEGTAPKYAGFRPPHPSGLRAAAEVSFKCFMALSSLYRITHNLFLRGVTTGNVCGNTAIPHY